MPQGELALSTIHFGSLEQPGHMAIDTIAIPNFQNGRLIKLELTMWGWSETLINSYTWTQRDTVQSAPFMIFSATCVIMSLTLF